MPSKTVPVAGQRGTIQTTAAPKKNTNPSNTKLGTQQTNKNQAPNPSTQNQQSKHNTSIADKEEQKIKDNSFPGQIQQSKDTSQNPNPSKQAKNEPIFVSNNAYKNGLGKPGNVLNNNQNNGEKNMKKESQNENSKNKLPVLEKEIPAAKNEKINQPQLNNETELKKQLMLYQQENVNLKEQISKLLNQNFRLEDDLQKQKVLQDSYDKKIVEISKAVEENKNLTKINSELKLKLDKLSQSHKCSLDHINELEKKIRASENQLQPNKIEIVTKENEALKKEKDNFKNQILKLEKEVALLRTQTKNHSPVDKNKNGLPLNQENKKKGPNANELQNKISQLEEELQYLAESQKGLQYSNEKMANKNKELQENNQKLVLQNQENKKVADEWIVYAEELENGNKAVTAENKNLKKINEDLLGKIKNIENQFRESNKISDSFDYQIKNLQTSKEFEAIKKRNIELEQIVLEKDGLLRSYADYDFIRNKNQEQEKNIQDLQKKNEELEFNLVGLKAMLQEDEKLNQELEAMILQKNDVENQNEELQEKLKNYDQLIIDHEKLKKQTRSSTNETKSFSIEQKNLENELQKSKQQIKEIVDMCDNSKNPIEFIRCLKNELQKKVNILAETHESKAKLQKEYGELEKNNQEWINYSDRLKEDIEKNNSELEKKTNKIRKLEEDHQQSQNYVKESKLECNRIKLCNDNLREENAKLIQKIESLEKETAQLKLKNTQLEAEKKDLKLFKDRLEMEDEKQKSNTIHSENEKADLKLIKERLEKESTGLKLAKESLEKENTGLQIAKENLEKENAGLKSIKESLEKESTGLKLAKESLEKENTGLKSIKESLEKENTGLKSIKESLEKENTGLKSVKESLERENTSLKSIKESLERENTSLKSIKESLEKENTSLKSTKESLEKENTGLKSIKESLEKENTGLKSIKESLEKEKTQINKQEAKKIEDLNKLVKELQLKNELKELPESQSNRIENHVNIPGNENSTEADINYDSAHYAASVKKSIIDSLSQLDTKCSMMSIIQDKLAIQNIQLEKEGINYQKNSEKLLSIQLIHVQKKQREYHFLVNVINNSNLDFQNISIVIYKHEKDGSIESQINSKKISKIFIGESMEVSIMSEVYPLIAMRLFRDNTKLTAPVSHPYQIALIDSTDINQAAYIL